MIVVLLVVLVLLMLGGLPTWHWHSYGWTPSGLLLVVIVVALCVWLYNRGRL